MISDEIIKDSFVTSTLKEGTDKIFTLQSEVAKSLLNEKTGRLFSNLEARDFHIAGNGQHYQVVVNILKYLRFNEIRNDIGLRGKLHLYNRIVWGVLYGETLPELKYGLTDEIYQQIERQLKAAGQQLSFEFEY